MLRSTVLPDCPLSFHYPCLNGTDIYDEKIYYFEFHICPIHCMHYDNSNGYLLSIQHDKRAIIIYNNGIRYGGNNNDDNGNNNKHISGG